MTDSNNLDHHFLTEASELLQTMEETLINLLDEKTVERVHSLMRSAHTLKGSAAHLELKTIENIAHELETVFESLYPEELEIDPELSALLLDAYECLRTPLSAILSQSEYDEAEIQQRADQVFSQIKEQLGDYYNNPVEAPTSEELGFDVLGSIVSESLPQDLENIKSAIAQNNAEKAKELCQGEAEFLLELASSYELSGLEEIARSTLTALELYPDRAIEIAQIAVENFQIAQDAITAGDRASGGNITESLKQFATEKSSDDHAIVAYQEPTPLAIYQPELPTVNYVPRSRDPVERILESISAGDPKQNFKQAEAEETGDSKPTPPPKAKPTAEDQTTIRVALQRINRLSYAIGELSIVQNQQSLQADRAHKISRNSRKQVRQAREQLDAIRDEITLTSRQRNRQNKQPLSSPSSQLLTQLQLDELEMDSYSRLHLLLQELDEKISDIETNLDSLDNGLGESRSQIRQEKQLLSNAQDELLQARMVPLETVLNRFPAMVQQLSKTYQKPVSLNITGQDVLVDKAISEKLYDPLLHLVRNAFAHAIESPQVREEKGKSPTGNINITAYRQGNRTLLEVSDDGKGLDWEHIREVARERHFGEVSNASEAELSDLLFQPGFSTAQQADELSGRGTGLDVVRNQIHGVEGTINLKSQRDRGTTFTLQLPLNIATARLLICQAGGRFYSLLAQKVGRMLLPNPEQIENNLLREEGEAQLLPIIPLPTLLGEETIPMESKTPLTPFPLKQRNAVNPLLKIETDNQPLCLQVDQILVEQELVIKTLPPGPNIPDYVQGYTVLADGSLSLVIDPTSLRQETTTTIPIQELSSSDTQTTVKALPKPKQSPVLVIEDSIVQRRSMVETLETAGYQVFEAGDGKAAIALLHQHPEISLILCDIEMPQMNGFEFLGHCRQREQLSQLPIIMLTSRGGEKHRRLALSLGAKDYITKPYSDRALLETIAQYA